MRRFGVVWSAEALDNLADIRAFIGFDDKRAAARVAQRILQTSLRLAELPHRGRLGRQEDTREVIVAGLPYVMVYRIDGRVVTVMAVLHFARDS